MNKDKKPDQSRCPVCKASDSQTIHQQPEFQLRRCNDCGLLSKIFPRQIDNDDIQALQNAVYDSLDRTRSTITQTMATDRLRLLCDTRKEGKLLEIGCATGEFLEHAEAAGFDASGIDMSIIYTDYAIARGLKVRRTHLNDIIEERQRFDVIVLFHLFEHIPTPNTFLQSIRTTLTPNGSLMIVVPNLDSSTNRPFGYRHSTFQQQDHLFFYNQRTLGRILENNGFKPVYVGSKEYSHNIFSSLAHYVARSLLGRNKPALPGQVGTPGPSPASNPVKTSAKRFANQLPYALGRLLQPLMRPYIRNTEKTVKGHELIIISTKTD